MEWKFTRISCVETSGIWRSKLMQYFILNTETLKVQEIFPTGLVLHCLYSRIQWNVVRCHQLMFCGLKGEREAIIIIHLAVAIDTQHISVWAYQQ